MNDTKLLVLLVAMHLVAIGAAGLLIALALRTGAAEEDANGGGGGPPTAPPLGPPMPNASPSRIRLRQRGDRVHRGPDRPRRGGRVRDRPRMPDRVSAVGMGEAEPEPHDHQRQHEHRRLEGVHGGAP